MPLSKIDSDSLNTPITAVDLAYTGTLTGGTGIVNIGSGQVYKDASGNVGIGTSSPAAKLDVSGQGKLNAITFTFSTSFYNTDNSISNYSAGNYLYVSGNSTGGTGGLYLQGAGNQKQAIIVDGISTGGNIAFQTNGSERMRIDSSGNVGIGTSSPNRPLSIQRGAGVGAYIDMAGNGNTLGSTSFVIGQGEDDTAYVYNRKNSPMAFATNNTERARIDSSGNLLVGTTSQTPGYGNTNTGQQLGGSSVSTFSRSATDFVIVCNQNTVDGSTYYQMQFRVSNVSKGSITSTSSATSYNTSSDYRLKNTIAPMTGALAKVALLKPCTYKWNIDGSDGQGFIAHELQEVVPQCITGTKDATCEEQYEVTPAVKDEEGNTVTEAVMGTRTVPKYQGIDTSFLVATLTAAIQELKAIVDAQGAEIAALKGTP